jgi:putative transposase
LYAYMGGIARENNIRLLEAGGQEDHIHLYVAIPSTITVAKMINVLKANSSRWIHESFANRRFFAWQEGYGAFSAGTSEERAIIEYIRNQDAHHKQRDFRMEFLELLKDQGIEFDSKYVFD